MIATHISDGGRNETHAHERKDCAVRGLAAAAGVHYDIAHDALKRAGREDRAAFDLLNAIRGNRIPYFLFDSQGLYAAKTVARFVQRHPQGRWLARVRAHVFAIEDGVICDDQYGVGGRHRIINAWKVRYLPQTYAARRMKLVRNYGPTSIRTSPTRKRIERALLSKFQ